MERGGVLEAGGEDVGGCGGLERGAGGGGVGEGVVDVERGEVGKGGEAGFLGVELFDSAHDPGGRLEGEHTKAGGGE